MGSQNITGQWSSYAYDGYGTMEDESLVFLPDQSGWYAFTRGWLCERETFTWALRPGNLLLLEGRQYAAAGEQPGSFRAQPSSMRARRMPIAIGEQPVRWPGHASTLVLTFASAPFAGSLKFALVAASGSEIVFPRFGGEPATD